MVNKVVEKVIILFFMVLLSVGAYAAPRMEGRFIQLQNTYTTPVWTQINFQQTYDSPPAVFMLSTNQGGHPAIIRIRNVTTMGFEALPLEPSGEDGEHITMGAHYFAVEVGLHLFDDGTVMEVGKIDTTNLQYGTTNYGNGDDFSTPRSWYQLNFATTFSQRPTFFHSLQTINNIDSVVPQTALVPFYTVAVRSNSLDQTGVEIALEASETIRGSLNRNETIAYMVVEPGNNRTFKDDDGNTVTWETLFSGKVIDGWSNGCNNVSFLNNYSSTPLVAASKVSRDENDGGWLRSCRLNSNVLGLVVDEDRSWDRERNHAFEEASILAMDRNLFVFSGEFPSCDALFPGAVATYSGVTPPNVGRVELNGGIQIIDGNGPLITTRNLQTTGLPQCNGSLCVQSSTDAISIQSANLIPSIPNDGSTITLPRNLAGDYFLQQNLVWMFLNYDVIAPTRIFIEASTPGLSPLLQIFFANINVFPGASLAIYIDGDISIGAGSNTEGFIIATGEVIIGSGVTHNGRITAGQEVSADFSSSTVIDATQGAQLPSFIKGICGSQTIEVVDHYRFEINSRDALTCEAKPFTIKACANASCDTLYSQQSTLDLSPDNSGQYTWSPSEVVNFIGQIDVSLARETARNNVTLAYNSASPSAPIQCYIGGNLVTGDCRINFSDSGFLIQDINGNALDDQISAQGFSAYLRAVKKNTTTGVCDDIFSGDQAIKFSTSYIAPNTSSGASNMNMSINGVPLNGATDVVVNFDPTLSQRAELSVIYPDAGQINIAAEKEVDTGATLRGNSDNFVVRPQQFVFELADNHQPGDASYATNALSSVFLNAGQDFPVKIKAINANGDTTLNFEQAQIVANAFALSHQLQAPTAGSLGDLTFESIIFVNGEAQFNANYDEVGIISLLASLNASDYLNHQGGGAIGGQMDNIGRFAPANFAMINQQVVPGCDVFTYQSQPYARVQYGIEALNLNGDRTLNYIANSLAAENYAKANISNLIENDAIDAAMYKSASNLASRYSITEPVWQNGLYAVDASDAILARDYSQLNVGAMPEAPMSDIYLLSQLSDPDGRQLLALNQNSEQYGGVPNSKAIAGPLEIRFGRLVVDNNYGSENETLQIPIRTEYWDGTNYRANLLDSCTPYIGSRLAVQDAHTYQGIDGTLSQGYYLDGSGFYLDAPGINRSFDVYYQSPDEWLRFDWNNDGNFNDVLDNPLGVMQFGRYRGNERVIYWQETR